MLALCTDDIVKLIFLYEICWIFIKISLKCVAKSPINSMPALIKIMAWHWTGNKPLSEWIIAYCHHASLGINAAFPLKIWTYAALWYTLQVFNEIAVGVVGKCWEIYYENAHCRP